MSNTPQYQAVRLVSWFYITFRTEKTIYLVAPFINSVKRKQLGFWLISILLLSLCLCLAAVLVGGLHLLSARYPVPADRFRPAHPFVIFSGADQRKPRSVPATLMSASDYNLSWSPIDLMMLHLHRLFRLAISLSGAIWTGWKSQRQRFHELENFLSKSLRSAVNLGRTNTNCCHRHVICQQISKKYCDQVKRISLI